MSYTNRLIRKTAVIIGVGASICVFQHINNKKTIKVTNDANDFELQHKEVPIPSKKNNNDNFFETKTAAGYTIRPIYTNRVNEPMAQGKLVIDDISDTNIKIDVQ